MECQFAVVVYLEHIVALFGLSVDPLDIEVVVSMVYLEHIVALFGLSVDPLDIEVVVVVASADPLHQFVVGMVLLLLHYHLE
jgi:hypothetical protein